MVTLTQASSSGPWKAATNTQEHVRFQDLRERQPNVFLKIYRLKQANAKVTVVGK